MRAAVLWGSLFTKFCEKMKNAITYSKYQVNGVEEGRKLKLFMNVITYKSWWL